jgi:hypothetical protein
VFVFRTWYYGLAITSTSSPDNVLEIVDEFDVKLKAFDSGAGKGEQQFHLKSNGELFNTKLGLFLGVNGADVKAHISPMGADTWEIGNNL